MLIDLTAVPEIREAVEKQDLVRDVSFLGLPETIGGMEVLPMSFRHVLWLELNRSPFLGHGPLEPANLVTSLAAFMKTVSPFHPLNRSRFNGWRQRRYLRRVGRMKLDVALRDIREYVSEAFMDAPSGGTSGEVKASYYSTGAAWVHRLCKNYSGLNPDPGVYPSAIDLPLKVGFQMLKLLKQDDYAKAGKMCPLFNPSDEVIGRHLETLDLENLERN